MPKPINQMHVKTKYWAFYFFKTRQLKYNSLAKAWQRAKLQQQTNQEMALDESSTTVKSYVLGFYPQDKLFQTKQGKETDLGSVEKCVGFPPRNRNAKAGMEK